MTGRTRKPGTDPCPTWHTGAESRSCQPADAVHQTGMPVASRLALAGCHVWTRWSAKSPLYAWYWRHSSAAGQKHRPRHPLPDGWHEPPPDQPCLAAIREPATPVRGGNPKPCGTSPRWPVGQSLRPGSAPWRGQPGPTPVVAEHPPKRKRPATTGCVAGRAGTPIRIGVRVKAEGATAEDQAKACSSGLISERAILLA